MLGCPIHDGLIVMGGNVNRQPTIPAQAKNPGAYTLFAVSIPKTNSPQLEKHPSQHGAGTGVYCYAWAGLTQKNNLPGEVSSGNW